MIDPRIYLKVFSRLHRLHQKSNERAASFNFFTPRGRKFLSLPKMETKALGELKSFYRSASYALKESASENERRKLNKSFKLEETRLLGILISIKTDIVDQGEQLIKPYLPSEISCESIEELLNESTGPNYAEIRKLRLRNLRFSELHDKQQKFFLDNEFDCYVAQMAFDKLVDSLVKGLADLKNSTSISRETRRMLKREIISFKRLALLYEDHKYFLDRDPTMLDIMVGSHEFLKRELAIYQNLKTSVFCF